MQPESLSGSIRGQAGLGSTQDPRSTPAGTPRSRGRLYCLRKTLREGARARLRCRALPGGSGWGSTPGIERQGFRGGGRRRPPDHFFPQGAQPFVLQRGLLLGGGVQPLCSQTLLVSPSFPTPRNCSLQKGGAPFKDFSAKASPSLPPQKQLRKRGCPKIAFKMGCLF